MYLTMHTQRCSFLLLWWSPLIILSPGQKLDCCVSVVQSPPQAIYRSRNAALLISDGAHSKTVERAQALDCSLAFAGSNSQCSGKIIISNGIAGRCAHLIACCSQYIICFLNALKYIGYAQCDIPSQVCSNTCKLAEGRQQWRDCQQADT